MSAKTGMLYPHRPWRCFWSWPWGHNWDTPHKRMLQFEVYTCLDCGKKHEGRCGEGL